MTLTDLAPLTPTIYALTLMTCITRRTPNVTAMSSAIEMPLSFKTTLTTTMMIHITGQAAPLTNTPEFGAASPPLFHPQRTLTLPMTTNGAVPILRTTLQGDHHLILKSVIPVCGLHIGLPTQRTTLTPEDPHVCRFLVSTAPIQG